MTMLIFLLGLIIGSVTNQAWCQAEMIVPISPSAKSVTIQPPVGLPTQVYTNPSTGVQTIQPPAELPSHVYTNPSSCVRTIQPPVGLPTMVYPGNITDSLYGGDREGR